MGPGGPLDLQNRWLRPFGRNGGFDSLALPPNVFIETSKFKKKGGSYWAITPPSITNSAPVM